MDVLICGICHEEFNDIVKFMDHKKLGFYQNSECCKIMQTAECANQQENNICILKATESIEENNITEIYANEISSIEQNQNTQVGSITLDDLGNVAMIPDQEGNIALMGNIHIVHSTDGDPAVVTVTPEITEGSEITTENAIFTLQSSDIQSHTEQNAEFVSFPSEAECNLEFTENRITPNNFSFQLKEGYQLEGIFACSLCQCFALTQNEIVNHIQIIHRDQIVSENKECEQFYIRLEPLKEPRHQIVQKGFTNQLVNSLKVYPISTNTEQEKSDAIHLVVETIKEQDTLIPLPSQSNPNICQVKKKRGRPRKSEHKKNVTEEQEIQPLPVLGSDGQYHCPRCKRAFKKERHILGHKCLGKGDYVDLSIKENCPATSEEVMEEEQTIKEETEDEEKEVDTDCTEDFKMYMPIDRPPWSRGRRGGTRGRGRGRGRGRRIYKNMEDKQINAIEFQSENNDGNKENQALISIVIEDIDNEVKEAEDASSGQKTKLNWRNDPHHIPVFNTEDERLAFEERLNSVDLSCVDHLYVRHEVTQEVDMSKMRKMTGRETNELLVFSCNICKKVFKSLSHMRLHCIIHTDLKPFKCPQCPFRSNAKGNLYTHMRKHTGNYFKCSQCNFQSRNRSHLAEHEATHSNRRHQCKLCENYYNTVKSLMNHVRKYHTCSLGREYLATFLVKPQNLMALLHICHICNRKFKKKIDRDRHLFIHNIRESPNNFHCNLCDYTACRRSYLENHHRRHRLVFVCCLCKNMFISTISLKNHLQDHIEKQSVDFQSDKSSAQLEQVENSTLESDKKEILYNKTSEGDPQNTDDNQIESFSALKALSKENNSDLLNTESNSFPENATIDSLFETSLNNSWYLPEPDGTVALSQYINIPDELRETQDQNESTNVDNQSTSLDETSQSTLINYSPIVSLNYKSLTVELYKKIQETFGTVECEYCGRLFHNHIDLEHHVMTHSENKPFKCDKCSYTSASKENLKRHQESIHEGRKFSCDKCDFVASSRTTYWHHRQKHLITAQCNICNKQFPTTRILKNHVLCKHPEIDQSELQKLLGNNHRVIGRIGRCSYKCPYCSRVFHRSSADLQKHIWIHEGIKPFKCSECSHTCRSRNNLKIHMLRHSNDKPHLCEECGKSYKSKTALKCHIKSHFVDGTMFQCDQCDYTVNQKSNLKRHMESHQLLRRYTCEFCDYSSSTVGYMRVHYNRKHKGETFVEKSDSSISIIVESQEQVYKCLSCKCIFENVEQTKQHLKDEHGISAETIDSTLQETIPDSIDRVVTNEDENIRFETDTVMMDGIQETIEMIELQDNNNANSVISTFQGVQLTNIEDGEMDEKTANAVNLIQQIIEQGAIEPQVTLHSVDGQSLVAVNPGAIIVQDGHELVLNGTNLDEQYVIQYVTDTTTTPTNAEIHIQPCEEVEMCKDFDNQIEIQYDSTKVEENIIEEENTS